MTRGIAELLHVFHLSVVRNLKTLRSVNGDDFRGPHVLTENNLMNRISICDTLLEFMENNPLFKTTITGDEKWIV